jgi:hypothetical protein
MRGRKNPLIANEHTAAYGRHARIYHLAHAMELWLLRQRAVFFFSHIVAIDDG